MILEPNLFFVFDFNILSILYLFQQIHFLKPVLNID